MLLTRIAVAFLGAALVAGTAQATIISGSVTGGSSNTAGGVFIELDANAAHTVGNDNFQDHNLRAFNEGQNIVIGGPLSVDILAPGPGGGVLAAGTVVASHYIVYDPGPTSTIQGSVEFDSIILAIITDTTKLANSDYLINNNVNYLNPSARGLEGNDTAWIGAANQVMIDFYASTPGDVIRVLTAYSPGAPQVPEPATLALFGLGLAGLGVARRRRSKK